MVTVDRYFPVTASEASQIIADCKSVEIRGTFGYKVNYRLGRLQWDWDWIEFAASKVGSLEGDTPEGWSDDVWRRTQETAKQLEGTTRPDRDPILTTTAMTGVVDYSPADQTVTVRAGTELDDLQQVLREHDQCLPLPNPEAFGLAVGGAPGTIGGMISMNLPHGLEYQCGSWRDWVLGMSVVLASGMSAKCGSRVVKNVAGYDAMKLFVGARGSLGLICDVTLKTFPLGALPRCRAVVREDSLLTRPTWIQRTLPTNYKAALAAAGDDVVATDPCTSTIWANIPYTRSLSRFSHDWVLRASSRHHSVEIADATNQKLMIRAKQVLDPTHKLNRGEFGFI